MINPISVIFAAGYLYNYQKSKDRYLSLGYAYSISTLTLLFSYSVVIGLIALITEQYFLFDKYGYFGGAEGFIVVYVFVMISLADYFDGVNNSQDVVNKLSVHTWFIKNIGNFALIPLFASLITTFLIVIFLPN